MAFKPSDALRDHLGFSNTDTMDEKWVIFNLIFIGILVTCLLFACINLLGCCPKACFCMCRPRNNSRWTNVSGTILTGIIVACFSYYVWFSVVDHLFDQHQQMKSILDATTKLADVIIDGEPETKDSSVKRWKGLKYLEAHVTDVSTSSAAVATGFNNTFDASLHNTTI